MCSVGGVGGGRKLMVIVCWVIWLVKFCVWILSFKFLFVGGEICRVFFIGVFC